jgi:hypothetical protein
MIKAPKRRVLSGAKAIALVGVTAATVECAKLALSALPNIELVTLLVALYGYVFGWLGVCSAVVFVCIEPLIYGINSWVITYFIYWPLVALVFMLLRRARVRNRWILTAAALGLTVFFGILSSIIDSAIMLGINEYYFKNLIIFYLRGVVFYIVQIACNATIFPLLFLYLADKLRLIRRNMRI